MRFPILFVGLAAMLLSFLAGINTILFIAVAAIFILIFVALFLLKEKRLHFIIAVFLLLLLVTSILVNISAIKRINCYKEENAKITAVITEAPIYNGMNYSYVAKIKAIDSKRINFTKIRINSEEDSFEVGDTVEAQVTFFEYDNKEGFYAENIYMGSDLKRIISVKQNNLSKRALENKLMQNA